MPDLLKPEDVARLLNVSSSTVRRWITEGHLPAIRTPGRRLRIREADALKLIEPPVPSQLRPADEAEAVA